MCTVLISFVYLYSVKVAEWLLGCIVIYSHWDWIANMYHLNFNVPSSGVQYVPGNSYKVHRRASWTAWWLALHYVTTVNTPPGHRHALLYTFQTAGSPGTHKVGFIWNTPSNGIILYFCVTGSHLKWALSSAFYVVSSLTRPSPWTTKWSLAGWNTS